MMPKSPCGKELVPYRQAGAAVVGRWAEEKSELMACPSCGYLAFEPVPTEAVLSKYYGSQYWEMGGSLNEAKSAYADGDYYVTAARDISETWKALGPQGETLRVHEVGCGYGATVHFLRRLDIEATGSDLSTSAVDIARQLGNPHTYSMPLTDFLADRPYDPINFFFMAHSLEHIPEPASAVHTIFERLPRGGVFMFRVPNGMHLTSRLRSFYEYTWLQYPDHIHYFTPRSAICILEQAGFEVVDVRVKSREDHAGLLFSAAFGRTWSELPDPSALIEALAKNWLGMELEVIARKPTGSSTQGDQLRDRAERFERTLHTMQATDVIAGDNAVSFTPNPAEKSNWTFTTLSARGETPLRPAADGKALEADGARVHRSNVFVVVGQTLIMRRTLGPDKASGIAEIAFSAVMPYREGDLYEVSALHDGRVLLREQHEAAQRVSRRMHVKAEPGQTLEVRIRPIKSDWPSLHVQCKADWISLA